MQYNFTTLAALAGGLFLFNRMRHRRASTTTTTYELDRDGTGDRRTQGSSGSVLSKAAFAVAGGLLAASQLRKSAGSSAASSVQESIELDVPVSTAYNQWTQFEDFPKFMASVDQVNQVDDTHLHWRATVAGKTKEWDAEITEQIPDQRIAWRSTDGVANAGVVTFHKVGENRTRVMLQMDYQPDTVAEKLGDALGGVKFTTKGNLKRFKQLVEERGMETGAWRGTVAQH